MSETSDSTTTPSRSQAREVREEDAFDVEALADWLRDNASPEWADSIDGTPEVRQFAGGASNLTYLLTYSQGTELILRRPPG
ncbi:MAG: phosphotransferase family protein, partial [Candidatus Corynebacterium faecigallinarum]